MSNGLELINELVQIAKNPDKAVKDYTRKTGKKAVGWFPVYGAEEILYAAGMLPVGMWGGQTSIAKAPQYLQTFCCSVMKANLENGMKGVYNSLSAVVIPTFCDTLKCVSEVWKAAVPELPSITFVFPQNRKIDAGIKFMEDELARLKKELEKMTGKEIKPEDIAASIDIYNNYRKVARKFVELSSNYPKTISTVARHNVLKAAFFMDKKEYSEHLSKIIEALKNMPSERTNEKGIVITGLLAEPDEFLELFDANGFVVTADDLVQESKQFRVDVPRGGSSPINRLAKRLVDMDGCSLLYDYGKSRGQKLIDMVSETKASGVVVCMMKFCDPEEFDYPIYKKELEAAGIPILYLEIEQQMDSVEQFKTRMQAFSEII